MDFKESYDITFSSYPSPKIPPHNFHHTFKPSQYHTITKEVTSFLYQNNAHIKRNYSYQDLVIMVGDKNQSCLLDKAVPISSRKIDQRGRSYHAVSPEMEEQLGITGSIQRSIPPRIIKNDDYLINLRNILKI